MNLYIDANIFLDFYHLTSTDLEELRKLVALIEQEKVKLFMPSQTCDEISRNRDAKISDAMVKFRKNNSSFKLSFPAFMKSYEEFEEIRDLLKSANRMHSDLYRKAMDSILLNDLDADKLISDLIKAAEYIKCDVKIFNSAINRFRKGNPPGKGKNTVGDEINWEALKAFIPDGEDLFLVSGDRDYKSILEPRKVNGYLSAEWKFDKKGELHFFDSLTGFFKEKFPDIILASDVKNVILIEKLSLSSNFATTHTIIGALSKQDSFSSPQVEELISIADLNSQVNWIIGDEDVHNFYASLKERYSNVISEGAQKTLDELLGVNSAEEANDAQQFDSDIPF